jgi:quercetin dioxygenase-like cupin family protein
MEKWSLAALADGLLGHALTASSRRSMRTIHGGPPHRLLQSVIALARGQRLYEHDNQGEVTVQVLRGRVRMVAGAEKTDASAGQLLIVPHARHTVVAVEDAVLLRTAVKPVPLTAADAAGTGLPRFIPAPTRSPVPARGRTDGLAATTLKGRDPNGRATYLRDRRGRVDRGEGGADVAGGRLRRRHRSARRGAGPPL